MLTGIWHECLLRYLKENIAMHKNYLAGILVIVIK
nr:MAG TPA: hypothetical protein [Caudoviricetes sp.]